MTTPLFAVQGLHARAGGVEILKGIDLTVHPGEVHALMGPNGAGKSTLAGALMGSPEVEITAITMRADRPIYRNHQTCPETDHQPLPRLCHEAVLYNRLTEIGCDVRDVRFRPGAAHSPASCSSIIPARASSTTR